MSITAVVKNYIAFTGDQEIDLPFSSEELTNSPALQELVSLVSGNNAITVPDVDGFTLHGVAIVPPASNTVEPTLKGVNGDTGITLSVDKVSIVPFGATPSASFVLSVTDDVAGYRLIWF